MQVNPPSPLAETVPVVRSTRERLPADRFSITRTFHFPDDSGELLDVEVTVGLYPSGAPGELFIRADKVGTLEAAMFNAMASAVSIGLQYGAPLDVMVSKWIGTNFCTEGETTSNAIDVIGRWLRERFCEQVEQ